MITFLIGLFIGLAFYLIERIKRKGVERLLKIEKDDKEFWMNAAKSNSVFNEAKLESKCTSFFAEGNSTGITKCKFCGKEKWEY